MTMMLPQFVPVQFEDARKAYRCGWQFGFAIAHLKMAEWEGPVSYPMEKLATSHEREAFDFAVHRGMTDAGMKVSAGTKISH
jgi:hypothetical protein